MVSRVDKVYENTGIDTPMILVGNKSDLSKRTVSEEDAQEMAKSLKMIDYIETSVKDNINVMECFHKLIDAVLDKAPEQSPPEHSPPEPDTTVKLGNNNRQKKQCKC